MSTPRSTGSAGSWAPAGGRCGRRSSRCWRRPMRMCPASTGVTILGVDEHVWHHVSTKPVEDGGRGPKELTGMVDLTRDDPRPASRARLLDLVPGRSGETYAAGCTSGARRSGLGSQIATLDPFHGYKNAIDDQLAGRRRRAGRLPRRQARHAGRRRRPPPGAAGHHGHRGRQDDPLYRIRNILRAGEENLTDRQRARLARRVHRRRASTSRSRSPGGAPNRSAPPTTRTPTPPAARSPRRSSTRSPPARSPRSPASGGP